MENNILFYEELKKEYKINKKRLWKNLGGFIAFNYNYFEKINKVAGHEKYLTIKDLINDNAEVKLIIQLMIEDSIKEYLNELYEENFFNKIMKITKNDDEDSEEKKSSVKSFSEFVCALECYNKEIKDLVSDILKDVEDVNIHFVSLKYKIEGEELYRNSKFRLADIHSLMYKSLKFKSKKKIPNLISVSHI
jgi:hypothetical protein